MIELKMVEQSTKTAATFNWAANRQLDVLFVHPGDSSKIYQGLSDKFSAIETPTWSLLLAQSCRSKGFGVAILDCDAERLSYSEAVKRIKEHNPRLVCFVVYGQNPNAGTTKMTGAIGVADYLRLEHPEYPICFVGSHASALPKEVLAFNSVDFVLLNEGVYALQNLLRTDFKTDLQNIKGIGWKDEGKLTLNASERVVPQELMDTDLPGYAWDLLPYRNKPFDLYRSCNWHANYIESNRTPYASLYTSLGCRFKCSFCMINIVNRTNNDDNVTAENSNNMRFWSPEFISKEIDKLVDYGVKTVRIADEMFLLNKKYYEPFVKSMAEKGYGDFLNFWSYARVDTVNEKSLQFLKKGGINWLALGIESVDQKIRQEISKGSFKEVNIREVIKLIEDAGLYTIANYIFGLPDDNYESINRTLDTAIELNTETANFYPCFALPGSPLHLQAKNDGTLLPKTFDAWSFHSYESLPLPTKHLSAAEVLRFRDNAWRLYFSREEYQNKVKKLFGDEALQSVKNMLEIRLKRKLLGD